MATDSSPADAFEALRREVALLRRALEGLAAEQKAQPDYSSVLAGIGTRIKEQNTMLGAMAKAPEARYQDLERMRAKFPTGALAVLEFDGSWADLAEGGASLVAFVTPKDLA